MNNMNYDLFTSPKMKYYIYFITEIENMEGEINNLFKTRDSKISCVLNDDLSSARESILDSLNEIKASIEMDIDDVIGFDFDDVILKYSQMCQYLEYITKRYDLIDEVTQDRSCKEKNI